MLFDWLASATTRRLAREEATYAMREHGERAEDAVRTKMEQTTSEQRRQIYRLTLKALRDLR
ncbi:hypothetical protein [Sphingomonas oryzagri]|uniref:Uncharacterized protein n=1 Tax=Sphingomonas oryzagri TaxID=3042314 RepID=A0ABT6MXD8_9SPHN|nr:hypothetical protein [Sphingomonas oryzagri]MDH7637657.1 hypothetical protein [Sphingomonas oryzagri]